MDRNILERVMKATQLTKLGRLREATALLLNKRAATVAPARAAADDVIDVTWTEVEERPERTSGQTPGVRTASAAEAQPHAPQQETGERFSDRARQDTKPAEDRKSRGAPGQLVSGLYANAAGERAYKLYVPSRYAGQPLPLVVMLHGCNQSAEDFAVATRMSEAGERAGCFVLYPEQPASANHGRCWNWFRRQDQIRHEGEPSILAGMTRELVGRYSMDSGRVFVAGLSAGGAMAAVLGSTYSDIYAAIGIHSGLPFGSAHDLPSALAAMRGRTRRRSAPKQTPEAVDEPVVPTIVFHGDADGTVHPDNGAQVIEQSAHHGQRDNSVSKTSGREPGGHAFSRTIHRDSAGRVVLEYWVVHGGGHAWFGGSPSGSYTDPKGPDATQEMMRFFLEQT